MSVTRRICVTCCRWACYQRRGSRRWRCGGPREAVRHRCKLVALRSGLKAQVHAVLTKQGVRVAAPDVFGAGGQQLLDNLQLDPH